MIAKLLASGVLILIISASQTSNGKPNQTTLQDPNLITGVLKNGLKYAILPSDSDTLSILLQVNIGSRDELDQQQGYAHLIEHMAFQGTTNFNRLQLQRLYRRSDVQLGTDLNALTYYDRTHFFTRLQKNSANEKNVSAFLQWMADISQAKFNFEDQKLQVEKEVVLAEALMRKTGSVPRFKQAFNSHLLLGSNLEKRLPIGKVDIIRQASTADLTTFSQRFYTPKNSLLIISGKQADSYLVLVKNLFQGNDQTLQTLQIKRNATSLNNNHFYFKQTTAQEFTQLRLITTRQQIKTSAAVKKHYLAQVYRELVYTKLRDANAKSNPKMAKIVVFKSGNQDQTTSVMEIQHANNQQHIALELLSNVIQQLMDKGVNDLDYAQLKSSWGKNSNKVKWESSQDTAFKIAAKINQKDPYISYNLQYQLASELLENISLNQFNLQLKGWLLESKQQWAFSGSSFNQGKLAKLINLPIQSSTPAVSASADIAFLTQFQGHNVSTIPAPVNSEGHIITERSFPDTDVTSWQLSNNIEVLLLPRSSSGISMLFIAKGGISDISKEQHAAAKMVADVYSRSGQSWISDTELEKLLTDNNISLHAVMNPLFQGLEMKTSVNKINMAFSLLHSTMNHAIVNPATFQAIQQSYINRQQKLEHEVFIQHRTKTDKARYGQPSHNLSASSQDYKEVLISQLKQLYQQKYLNAQGYTLAITGDFKIDEIKPLVKKYIASLNTTPSKSSFQKNEYRQPSPASVSNLTDSNPLKSEKAYLNYAYLSPVTDLSIRGRLELALSAELIYTKLYAALREKGLAYGVNITMQYHNDNFSFNSLEISIQSDPLKVTAIRGIIKHEVQQLLTATINTNELTKVKKRVAKSISQSMEHDQTMNYILATNHLIGLDFTAVINHTETLATITPVSMKKAINQYLNDSGKQVAIYYQ